MAMQSAQSQSIKKSFTGNHLKLIAIIAMLIDHIASTLALPLYLDAIVVNEVIAIYLRNIGNFSCR